jgi:Tfp pilus assembly protein PilF
MLRVFTAVAVFAFLAGSVTYAAPTQRQRYTAFEKLLNASDLSAAQKKLNEWEAASPTDVELAVAWGNYYARAGSLPIQVYAGERNDRNVEPNHGSAYQLTKPGTTEPVGILDARPRHSEESLRLAVGRLQDAVTTYPQRADIWMGIAHVQLMQQDHDAALETLSRYAQYAHDHAGKMLWRYDEPLKEKMSEFIPGKLHSYAVQGMDEETTAGREFLLKVARLAQRLYPQHPYAYNDEAAYYNYMEDDAQVLKCLARALEVRPKDALVMMNMAATYKNMKNWDKAAEYYKLAIKTSTDDELKSAGREELKDLEERRKSR